MRRIGMLCFTPAGLATARRLKKGFAGICPQTEVTVSWKSAHMEGSIDCSAAEWAGSRFSDSDAMIFVGACGIAVRSIAPFIVSKKTDPAVLVADECGRYVISLLSGHLGGANELTLAAAGILNAEPVITTATDLHGAFAVDVFAAKNGCRIRDLSAAKEVSAALLAGEPVGFFSDLPWEGQLPGGLTDCSGGLSGCSGGMTGCPERPAGRRKSTGGQKLPGDGKNAPDSDRRVRAGICISIREISDPFPVTCRLIPRIAVLGMGCRKNAAYRAVSRMAGLCLDGICPEALEKLASIDVKKNEPSLVRLAGELGIPFETWSAGELAALPGDFASSGFVKDTVNVDNVCERSAVASSGGGALFVRKKAENGVTGAVALRRIQLLF